MSKVIVSPIRWAGSKRKLLDEMLFMFDKEKQNYVEPFLGSGVVLLNVLNNGLYRNYYVNDNNENLVNFYLELKDNTTVLLKSLKECVQKYNDFKTIEAKSDFYYKCRIKYNDNDVGKLEKAILFWFLMKTGFNGVYRVNSKNKFNVPFGKRDKIVFDEKKMLELSKLIQNVYFFSLDYDNFLKFLEKEDKLNNAFIYCDPPYIPETKSTEKHVIYSKDMFNHDKFKSDIKNIIEQNNANVMVSMSQSKNSKILYDDSDFQKYIIADIMRKVNPKKQIESKEIAYTNYVL